MVLASAPPCMKFVMISPMTITVPMAPMIAAPYSLMMSFTKIPPSRTCPASYAHILECSDTRCDEHAEEDHIDYGKPVFFKDLFHKSSLPLNVYLAMARTVCVVVPEFKNPMVKS